MAFPLFVLSSACPKVSDGFYKRKNGCRSEAAAVYWAVLKGRLCYLWEPGASPLFFTGIPGGILIDGITAVIADAALRGGQEKSGNYTA